MGDDWQVGDLALCVRSGRSLDVWEPQKGGVYTVCDTGCGPRGVWLDLVEDSTRNPDVGWPAVYFRKIRPHTPDAEDAETIALLTGKPAQVPA